MIRLGFRVVFVFIALFVGQSVSAQGAWEVVGTAGFSGGSTVSSALVVSASGTPFVAFSDSSQSNRAVVMSFNGTTWNIVGAPLNLSAPGPFALALDSNNLPYIASRDQNGATVMRFNGTSWVTVGSPRFSPGNVSSYISLELDENDIPHVAFQDAENGDGVTVMRFNGTSWVTVGSPGFSTFEAYAPNMAISSDGTLYVVYTDPDADYAPTVQRFNGTSWVPVGPPGFIEIGAYPFIALDANDVPHVALFDFDLENGASVYRFNGTSWVLLGERAFSEGDTAFITLAFDNDNVPYVAYQDSPIASAITVQRFNGTDWEQVGNRGFSGGGVGYGIGLAFDGDVPYVSYQDVANGNRATVMRFDASVPPVIAETVPVPAVWNTPTPQFTFSSTQPGTILYGGGCSSATNQAVAGSNLITLNPLSAGMYSGCTIRVRNQANILSNLLTLTSFTITSGSSSGGGSSGGRRSESTRVGVRDANNNSLNTVPAVPPGTVCTLGPILRTLNLGAEGEDVRALQRFLNCRGFIVAQSGVGAPGFETNYYGNLTQAAVIRFQNAYAAQILAPLNLVTGTGIFGERSRMHAMTLSNTR